MSTTDLETFIHLSKYARYNELENRRETWAETVDRYIDYFRDKLPAAPEEDWERAREAIFTKKVMPSMRALMTAGEALDRDNVAGYNCAYIPIDSLIAFDEIMYILLCGTGAGYSVERQYTNKLPLVGDITAEDAAHLCRTENFPNVDAEELSIYDKLSNTIIVTDSKIGWASAIRVLICQLFSGNYSVSWDLSLVRPKGQRLKVFGGRSSGPEPLNACLKYIKEVFNKEGVAGRRLTSLECHDIACKIAESVVVGGVRRAAMICLSNLSDERMRDAKKGAFYETEPQRALANNSVCYTEKPDTGAFLREWTSLHASRSGERGIFNREAARLIAGRNGRRDTQHDFGSNPCSEIILRPRQFCNLTEVIVRENDTYEDLSFKTCIATMLGTAQATLTDFRYLSPEWKENCEEERLLGVSHTGIYDNKLTYTNPEEFLGELKKTAVHINKAYARLFEINPATAVTCVKPSGTVSQLCNTSSGIHPRRSKFYLRRYRATKDDPLATFMIAQGIPHEDQIGNPYGIIFTFPIKAPEHSLVISDVTAIEHLELWKKYQLHWCEHKPSITINLKESEWVEVGAWVFKNFDILSGVSFLPMDNHVYEQAPEEAITEAEYDKWVMMMPKNIDWSSFKEITDNTTASQEYACVGNTCEIL